MIAYLRSHLSIKLFLLLPDRHPGLCLRAICVGVSRRTASLQPAYAQHANGGRGAGHDAGHDAGAGCAPGRGFGGMMGGLFANFLLALRDSLTWAALAATLAGVLASLLVARQVVAPVRADAECQPAHRARQL